MFGRTHTDTAHVVPDKYSNIIGRNFLKPLDILVHCKGQDILNGEILKGMPGIELSTVTPTTDRLGRVIPKEFTLDDEIGAFPDYRHTRKNKELRCQLRPIFHSLYRKGDKVIVKLLQVRNGMVQFPKPMMVKEVLGYYTSILDDGTKRNVRRLKRWTMEQTTPTTAPHP